MRHLIKSNRTRGKHNRNKGSNGNHNNLNRVYDSTGPESKVRGTPQQLVDKYLVLARDSQTSGDRVLSENYLQHAEHYIRVINSVNANIQAKQAQNAENIPANDDSKDSSSQHKQNTSRTKEPENPDVPINDEDSGLQVFESTKRHKKPVDIAVDNGMDIDDAKDENYQSSNQVGFDDNQDQTNSPVTQTTDKQKKTDNIEETDHSEKPIKKTRAPRRKAASKLKKESDQTAALDTDSSTNLPK